MIQRLDGHLVRRQQLVAWLGLLVGGVGFGIGALSNPSALKPLWHSDSALWLIVLAIAASAAAALQRIGGRPTLFAVVLGGAVTLAAFGVAAVAAVLLMVVACYALGGWLLDWAQEGRSETAEADVFIVTAVGLSACSLLLGFTAHARINVPIAYLALGLAAMALGRRHLAGAWKRLLSRRVEGSDRIPTWVCAPLWFAFGIHLCFAALPERYFDALAMHLVIPRALQLSGSWHFDAREMVWAVQPMGANWLFGWAYVLAGEYGAKLLNAVLLLLTCGLIVEAGVVSRPVGFLAAATFALMPLTFVETASLFVENALTLFVATMVVFAMRVRESPAPSSVAGFSIAAAGAIAVKLHGVIALAATGLAMLVFGGWRDLFTRGRRTLAISFIVAAAALLPYAYAWRTTGNPVFPYFNGVFKSPHFPQVNFESSLYPGGISASDFFDLTFQSAKYLEARDGALGFAIPLLLPVGLLLIAVEGSLKSRMMAMATVAYIALVLMNTRYLRYIFPVFPFVVLVLAYPLAIIKSARAQAVILAALVAGVGWGIVRIPAAGWILSRLDLPAAFSAAAKEARGDAETPLRKLERIQAAAGTDQSRVVIFGQSIGADIRGRPIYVSWYYPALQAMTFSKVPLQDAAGTLAALDATHVIFDLPSYQPEWAPWQEAADKYGRLIARTAGGELYEFHASSVPAANILEDPPGPWQRWDVSPEQKKAVNDVELTLPPGAFASRAADVARIPDGAQVSLSAQATCREQTSIRAQMNWLHADGSIIRTDADRAGCAEKPGPIGVQGAKPRDAAAVYLYFLNDGGAEARLYEERATAMAYTRP